MMRWSAVGRRAARLHVHLRQDKFKHGRECRVSFRVEAQRSQHPRLICAFRYSAKGSFVEVYNEKIRDLLDTRNDDLKVIRPHRRYAPTSLHVAASAPRNIYRSPSLPKLFIRSANRPQRASTSKASKRSRCAAGVTSLRQQHLHSIIQRRFYSEDVWALLALGDKAKAKAATAMNARSSRSHR